MRIAFLWSTLLLVTAALSAQEAATTAHVQVTAYPDPIFIEQTRLGQNVSADFGVKNLTPDALELTSMQVSVMDASGKLAFRKTIDADERRNIEYLPQREVAAGKVLQIYNPLNLFANDIELNTLRFDLVFSSKDGKHEYRAQSVIRPLKFQDKTPIRLPLKGRIFVWDGHELYSHHRHFDFLHGQTQRLGFRTNFQRYGFDFVFVDEAAEMYHGDPKENAAWFGFGKPVHAVAAGRVADVHDSEPDNRSFDQKELERRELAFGGNYVIIDHQNGEYSYYGHLKQASVRVKLGQSVKAGEIIGAVGASGSSLFPHLHFQMQNHTGARNAEGLPAYFRDFKRVTGARSVPVSKSSIDTGDIVEND